MPAPQAPIAFAGVFGGLWRFLRRGALATGGERLSGPERGNHIQSPTVIVLSAFPKNEGEKKRKQSFWLNMFQRYIDTLARRM